MPVHSTLEWTNLWADDGQNAPFGRRVIMSHLFKNNARGGVWYGSYTSKNGNRKQFTCKTKSEREARRFYQEKLQAIYDEEDRPKLKIISLSRFAEDYLAARRGDRISKSHQKELRASLAFLQRALGDVQLHTITVADCDRFISRGWKPEGWPSRWTQLKHYSNLKAVFRTAKRWQHIRENPFEQIDKPKPEERIPEILSRQELMRLLDSLPEETGAHKRIKNIVILAVSTGLRLSECLHLERRDLDFQKREILVRAKKDWSPKSRKPRVVPISGDTEKALRNQLLSNAGSKISRIQSSSYVFSGPHGFPVTKAVIEHPFMRVCADLFPARGLHFHSLRHTFGSFLAEAGVPLQEIQRIMGHSSVRVTEIYARLRNNDFSNALNALNKAIPLVRPMQTETEKVGELTLELNSRWSFWDSKNENPGEK
jgi:integrase/recombinase XerC